MTGDHYSVRSIVEATVTQLLVDSLADARHVLLTEQQGLLHGKATAVLTDQDKKTVSEEK